MTLILSIMFVYCRGMYAAINNFVLSKPIKQNLNQFV